MEQASKMVRSKTLAAPFVLLLAGAFALLALTVGWLVWRQAQISREGRRLNNLLKETLTLNERLRFGSSRQAELVRRFVESGDDRLWRQFDQLHFELSQQQTQYLKLDIGLLERRIVSHIGEARAQLEWASEQAAESVRGGKPSAAREALALLPARQAELDNLFRQLNTLQVRKVGEAWDRSAAGIADLFAVAVGAVVAFLVTLAGFAYLLRQRIQRPVQSLLETAVAIRGGELSARAPVHYEDEIGRLARELGSMAESLEGSYHQLEHKVEERTRELRELQEQLVQTEKLSAIGQLVSGVAHELNNPLTTVIGYAELGIQASSPDTDLHDFFAHILDQGDRCRRIVADLLQFARQRPTSRAEVRLNDVVGAALRLKGFEARNRKLRVVEELDPADPRVYADGFKIQQVVLALLNNAVDAILESGTSAGTIWIRTQGGPREATLEVRDNGGGIAEPSRVFEPFYTTKEPGKGTGLGLSIAYGIVQEHGGTIQAANWEDGARLFVALPTTAQPGDTPREEVAASAPTATRGRVLVVDDEMALVNLARAFLGQMGLEVAGATSGEEAISILLSGEVDAIVCDVRIPGKTDGLGVYDWVRGHRPALAQRFLFISGDLVSLEDRTAGQLPARCLRKPFRANELKQEVSALLERVPS